MYIPTEQYILDKLNGKEPVSDKQRNFYETLLVKYYNYDSDRTQNDYRDFAAGNREEEEQIIKELYE